VKTFIFEIGQNGYRRTYLMASKCKYTIPNLETKVSISKKLKLKNEMTGQSQTFAFQNGTVCNK
jgi:hypothetical protein